jgi:hypothetical protein
LLLASGNFKAGFAVAACFGAAGCFFVSCWLLMGKGLEERWSGKEEKDSKKGGREDEEEEETVGRGLLVGRGLVGWRRSWERGPVDEDEKEGRGLERIWMGWINRMVPGVEAIDTGDAVTVLAAKGAHS